MALETPKPRYRQVADLLREAIRQGDYAPGSALPSQPELAERFDIAQTSVSKAIGILRREGLVRTTNAGSVVRDIPTIPRYAVSRYTAEARESGTSRGAFDAELRGLGLEPRTDLVAWGRSEAPETAAAALKITVGTAVALRKRHMFADDHPVQIATSFIPWNLAEGTAIAEQDTGPGGTYSRLAEIGRGPVRFTESLRVRIPEPDEAVFLRMSEEQQVYEVLHTALDAQGEPVEICIHVMPVHQWELHYEWPAE